MTKKTATPKPKRPFAVLLQFQRKKSSLYIEILEYVVELSFQGTMTFFSIYECRTDERKPDSLDGLIENRRFRGKFLSMDGVLEFLAQERGGRLSAGYHLTYLRNDLSL